MLFVKRHTLLDYPEYWFEIDEYEHEGHQMLVGHVVVQKFSPSIFKRIKHEWAVFRSLVHTPIFTWGKVDDAKFERFVTSLGYRLNAEVPEIVCNNGERRRLFIHTVG